MYYEASRDFYYHFLPVLFMKTEEQAVKDAKAAGEDKYFPALEKVIVDWFFHLYTKMSSHSFFELGQRFFLARLMGRQGCNED